jgi:hypothetical protein
MTTGATPAMTVFDVCQSSGFDEDRIAPGFQGHDFVFLFFQAGDGHDGRLCEGRYLAKAHHEITTIHVWHDQIDEHQIGAKCGRDIEGLSPAVGHMHLVAECFHEQTQSVSAVSVVINDENPKSFIGCRHEFVFLSRQFLNSGERGASAPWCS